MRSHRLARETATLGLFLVLAIIVFAHSWAHPSARVQGGNDPYLFIWFLRWVPYAISHGLNPWVTHNVAIPAGANVLWNTSVPLLGLLISPVTLLAGPTAAFTTLMTLGLALSGWVMYIVARRWMGTGPALVAGLVYGFGPPMIGTALGHLHLVFAVFPPLVLLLLDDLLVRGRPPVRTGLLLGLAATAQFFVGSEILTTTAIVAAIGLVILAIEHHSRIRSALRPAAIGIGTAALVTGVLLAEPLWYLFRGPQHVGSVVQPPGVAVSDLMTYVVPDQLQHFAPQGALNISRHHTSNASEVVNYLGIPLLLLLAYIAVRRRRSSLVQLFVPLGVIVSLLSLGPWLHIRGRNTGIDLPWRVVQYLPILKNVLPARLSLYVMGCVALVVAAELEAGRRDWRIPRWSGRAAVVVALLPLLPAVPFASGFVPVPSFFTTNAVHVLQPNSTVLVVPFPYAQHAVAMEWQAEAGLRYRMPGGYVLLPTPQGRAFNPPWTPLTRQLANLERGQSTAAQALATPGVRDAYRQMHPSAVVLGPCQHRAALMEFISNIVGHPPTTVGGVQLWKLPTER
jgi:hypothetical protein